MRTDGFYNFSRLAMAEGITLATAFRIWHTLTPAERADWTGQPATVFHVRRGRLGWDQTTLEVFLTMARTMTPRAIARRTGMKPSAIYRRKQVLKQRGLL